MCDMDTIGISTREIAQRSGVNISQIHYHFGNKDNLLLEVAENDILPVISKLQIIATSRKTAVECLQEQLAVMVEALHKYPYINRLLLTMTRDYDTESAAEASVKLVWPLYKAVSDVILAGGQSGEFKVVDPVFVFFIVSGAASQIFASRAALELSLNRAPLDENERDRFLCQLSSIIIDGIAVRP